MKVLFSLASDVYLRNFEPVLRELTHRRHEVCVTLHRPPQPEGAGPIAQLVRNLPGLTVEQAPEAQDPWHPMRIQLHAARDYLLFRDPAFNPSYRLRSERRVPDWFRVVADRPAAHTDAGRRALDRVLFAAERMVPPSPVLERYLRDRAPDVLALSPYVMLSSVQPDMLRAAQRLGLPTTVCVASWDNLSSKSRMMPLPDLVVVWNETQRREAVELHGADPRRVAVTGAQLFDEWFVREPRVREEFCARVGLDAGRPYLLYVCSSPFLNAPDEVSFVRRWIEQVRASDDERLASASVLVRPHPKRREQWHSVDLGDLDGVAVWPPQGAAVVDENARADYFDSLFHSAAVVGLNTSALIEAGIVGRPVHTILVPEYRESQDGTLHFRYLTEVGGGLVRVARDFPEHHAQLSQSIAASGARDGAAEAFVREFVRPRGLAQPATPLFVEALEKLTATPGAGARRPRSWQVLDLAARPVTLALTLVDHRGNARRELEWVRAAHGAKRDGPGRKRFLFLSLYGYEPAFYGRVGTNLFKRGHTIGHVTWSRRSAAALRRRGFEVWCLPDLLRDAGTDLDVPSEVTRLERTYDMLSLRDVYRTDPPLEGRSEAECMDWAIRHFRALERVFDEFAPEVVVPDIGSETMRTAAHLIGLHRAVDVLFLFYTAFPNPLRLYANTMQAPIVAEDDVRTLSPSEHAEVEEFVDRFVDADTPIRADRRARGHGRMLRDFSRHVVNKVTTDRDNEYLRPHRFVTGYAREKGRAALTQRLYVPLTRPCIYFPLHVTDDYKIKRMIPHCLDQASIIELIAESLPQGIDVVLKEHPMSIGRNPVALLRRLSSHANIRLVDPYTSSHELIRRARAVAVISSTVGLEALMHGKPVMTIGQPFYAGFGVTMDVDSFREIPEKLQALLAFEPDRERTLRFLHACMRRCYPGKPALVDDSNANARDLAASLHAAVTPVADGRPLAAA